jgi:hypothetical protein
MRFEAFVVQKSPLLFFIRPDFRYTEIVKYY